jgi:tellurite resistance protein
MALFDLKNIKKNIQKSADDLKKTVSDAAENLPDSVKNINVGDSAKDAANKGKSALGSLVSKGGAALGDKLDRTKKTDEAVKTALEKGTNAAGERIVSVKDSLKLIYCLMAADGSISPEEEEKFREIGNSLDPDFEQWKDELTADLSMKEAVLPDEDEYFDFIHDYAAEILYKAEDTGEGIGAKTLIWDLLVMAFSEGDYSANERRLVRFAAKALSIDPAIPLEMEQTLRTITALDKEEEWLKSMNRPYSVIEEQVNELKERRETIMTGVHALIED